jgi:hypothetical protein
LVYEHVDINEIQRITIDYQTIGYQRVQALTKTDLKWLIEAFGEPAKHQLVEEAWPEIKRDAIARYCWGELRSRNASARSIGLPEQTMDDWLREHIGRTLGYHKEWLQRKAARELELAELKLRSSRLARRRENRS